MRIETARPHSSRKTVAMSAIASSFDRVSLYERADLHGAVLRGRYERGDANRLVKVGEIGQEDATDLFFCLGEGAVGDDPLAISDADRFCRSCAVELVARDVRVGLAPLL